MKNKVKNKVFTRLMTALLLTVMVIMAAYPSVAYAQINEKEATKEEPKKPVLTLMKEEKEKEVRYPNKLTAKEPENLKQKMASNGEITNTNKGIPTEPTKARASVTENVNNANQEYPIHHGESDGEKKDKYSADARQFITFQTKNGKTFHLIINHDEQGENVMLLTEVSEDDLLNMVEIKEKPKEVEKEPVPIKEEVKPEKKEEKKSDVGTYLLLFLVVGGALGIGYYFKVVKKKEDQELEAFEEEDDDFFSEAEGSEETESEETGHREMEDETVDSDEDEE